MATSKPKTSWAFSAAARLRPGRRAWVWLRWPALAAFVLVALALGLRASPLGTRARLAASYGAHVACSCHFIGGRALGDCRKDFEPGMALVTLSADETQKSVTARLIPLASETAVYHYGRGCQLGAWR